MNESNDLLLESEIQSELQNLFALQDKNLTDKKEAIWLKEIMGSPIPAKAFLQGIRSLKGTDVDRLKFSTVIAAAQRFMEPVDREVFRCSDCAGSGIVTMRNEALYTFTLRCRCQNGQFRGKGLTSWEGQETQMSKQHGLLTKWP